MDKSLATGTHRLSLRQQGPSLPLWSGVGAGIFLLALVGGTVTVLLARFGGDVSPVLTDPYLHAVIQFTLWQAFLSTALSVGLAIPVARAFARRHEFRGRRLLLSLMGLPVVTPVIVAVLGIVAVYGRNGLLNQLLQQAGLSFSFRLYGLSGILLAHVFFNLPLAVRLLLPAWDRIPAESWRLASTLGMSSRQLFRFLEWPALSAFVPGALAIVFLLCFSSFAVVLVLGGGPATTTVEVAIYQALRFDFEPGRAAVLALAQLALCSLIAITMARWLRAEPLTPGLRYSARYRPDCDNRAGRWLDRILIVTACGFVGLPVAAIVLAGLRGPLVAVTLDSALWFATGRSLAIALAAAMLALGLALALAVCARHLAVRLRQPARADLILVAGSLTLAVPPMVIGTGLFRVFLGVGRSGDLALVAIALVNAVMVLPYAVRGVAPVLIDSARQHERLCAQLGITGWQRFKRIDWPAIRRPTRFAAALAGALSFGDMGVAALFDTSGAITLPVMLYHRMAAYRFDQAAVTALLLVLLTVGVFLLIDRGLGQWRS